MRIADKITTSVDDYDWTRGIDILPWEIPHPSGNPYRVNIWDFGGQEVYHATHQFFLSSRSVYVLVYDNRKSNTDFQYWLETIRLLGGETSPIIIVKNRKGECDFDDSKYQIENLDNVTIKATNLATNEGLDDLRQTIKQALCNLEGIGEPLLIPWANIRNVLQNLSQNRNYIDQYDYFDYCKQNGFQTREEMRNASRFFHELGICLHFQDERDSSLKTTSLDQTLILKPTWATDAIYKIYDDPEVKKNCGRFNKTELCRIWDDGDDAEKRCELLDLMKKFKLCYELRDQPNHYIAPTFLERDPPAYTWDTTDNLELRYFYTFKPRGLFLEFIVELHRQIADNQVWRHGVVLQNESGDVRAEVVEDPEYRETTIKIRVSGTGDKRRFLQVVAYELQKLQNAYDDKLSTKKFEYTTQVPCICSECKPKVDRHFYDWSVLEKRYQKGKTTVDCDRSVEEVNLIALIDNISNWRGDRYGKDRPDFNDGRSPITAPASVQNFYIQPQQTMTQESGRTINTGGGDYRENHISGNAQYAERDIINNPTPKTAAESLQEIHDLLTQLNLPNTSDRVINAKIIKQDLDWQQRFWAALKNAAPEILKGGAALALAPLGLTGAIAATTLNVMVEATRGALEAEAIISPDEPDPIDMAQLIDL